MGTLAWASRVCHPCDLWSFNYTQFLESTVMAEEEAKQKEALNATLKEYIAEWRKTRERRRKRRRSKSSKYFYLPIIFLFYITTLFVPDPRSAVCTSFTFQKQTRNTRNYK